MDDHFIIGFLITIKQLGDDNSIITTHHENNSNLTLNMKFKANKLYVVIGMIQTKDDETCKPEPSYAYFNTSVTGKTKFVF